MRYFNREVKYFRNNKRLDITFIKQDILGGFNTPIRELIKPRIFFKFLANMILPYGYLNKQFLRK